MSTSNPSSSFSVAAIMGTRPEIIKMAPVVLALRARGITTHVLHTGQHEEMAWPLYEFFGIAPQEVIRLKREVATLPALSSELMSAIGSTLASLKPAVALVHGDTSSAAMGALAASYLQIPVGHVEAGLRSGRISEPFPEEINRSLIGRVSQWHFAPTGQARDNLEKENVPGEVSVVGNTVVDAVLLAARHVRKQRAAGQPVANPDYQWFVDSGLRQLVLVTAHRRENWGGPMVEIAQSVARLLEQHPDAAVIWPVHLNPLVQDVVRSVHAATTAEVQNRWRLTAPLDYAPMVEIMDAAQLLLTDSGGIQEEGLSLHKPLLVMRDVTERPEVITCGAGLLVGTQAERILSAASHVLATGQLPGQPPATVDNPFGDGSSGVQIAAAIARHLPPSSL
ncbi:UDP-N-acetylglucosamine 2-epimerase (non-hydrolyzing) [Comamonas sp. JUb58]|uniref:non-hydrolyzing UDP-N-acetylglucosamine 2-epimerase n=1 Tax=Comamonas sp. JUb58 TaxID=2485114 RepID=UPI0010605F52|nr:UDP-N-acetylglucosamine 2-epimerase (non-hydrolyzing) [Comamonas sp. JUb58]TDS81610.1 UDP-N-acetylglucosamine 2-epimerase [Comamonas sp. JUb58]